MAEQKREEVLDEDGIDKLKMPGVISRCKANGIDLSDKQPIDVLKLRLKMRLLCPLKENNQELTKLHSDYRIDETRREDMRDLYIRIAETTHHVMKMDDPVVKDLGHNFPNIAAKMKTEIKDLEKSHAPVLVLGETGAGKSSFINLLLGQNILPSSILSNTHVVCEIKYHADYSAKLFPLAENQEPMCITSEEGVEKFLKDLGVEIQRLDDNKKGVYKLAEIFLPLNILKSGVIIVDSPGIGETTEMETSVLDYILNACTFIYVIDSISAGGMQQRMQSLLRKVYEKAINEQRVYQPERAVFICNKWDLVPPVERQDVKKDTIKKITQYWPFCQESQIFTFSTKEAEVMQNNDRLSPKFQLIMREINKLIPLGREIQILKSYKYLNDFLTRCLHCFGIHLDRLEMTAPDREKKERETKERLQILKGKVTSYFEEQNKDLRHNIGELAEKLKDFLREEESMAKICKFTKSDFEHEKDWKTVSIAIRSKVYDRIMELIKGWEEERGEFKRIGDIISNSLEEEFPKFKAEIFKAQQNLSSAPLDRSTSENDGLVPDLVRKQFEGLNFGMKIAVGVGLAPVLFLGMVFRLPVFGLKSLQRSILDLGQESNFKKSTSEEGKEKLYKAYARRTVDNITDKLELRNVIEAEIQPLFKYLRQQKHNIEMNIDSDIQLLGQLKEDARNDNDIRKTYSPMKEKFLMLQQELENFLFTSMPSKYSKDFKEFPEGCLSEWNEDSTICHGLEAKIYAARCRQDIYDGSFQDVCVRICSEEIKPTNVNKRKLIQEAYRIIDKPFMIKLLGITVVKRNHHQIFEPLQSNLRAFLPKRREDFGRKESWRTCLQDMFRQIVNGLDFLHDRSLVHFDLSLDTIGVDMNGKIKLTNINKPKIVYIRPVHVDGKIDLSRYIYIPRKFIFCKERSASLTSVSSLHNEALSGGKQSRSRTQPQTVQKLDTYSPKDDMYSVGLLMWEVWVMKPLYGEDPLHEVDDNLMNDTDKLRQLFDEFRPTKEPHFVSTPDSEDVIMSEWWTAINGCVNRKLTAKDWLSRWDDIKRSYPDVSLVYSSSHFCMSPKFD